MKQKLSPEVIDKVIREVIGKINWGMVLEDLHYHSDVEIAPDPALYISSYLSRLARETEECLQLGGGRACYEIWKLEFINTFLLPFTDASYLPIHGILRFLVSYLNDLPEDVQAPTAIFVTRLVAQALSAFRDSSHYWYFVEQGILPKPV